MKKLAKNLVIAILGYQVKKLRRKNNFKVIGVVGSIGKTSTKLAIARTLGTSLRVRYQDGNYNDLVTVPLVFFGQPAPSLFNPLAWLAVFWRNQKQIKKSYPYEVVVVELGSDGPGQISQFKKYLKLDIAVLTAITPEHMAFFGMLDAVATEELAVAEFSNLVLANADLCDQKYLKKVANLDTYTISQPNASRSYAEGYSQTAAKEVGQRLGLSAEQIRAGLQKVAPVPGRMQQLAGVNGSTIIDDTYNASPAAVKLALETLYKTEAPQKIAVLGNMNELGDFAETAHKQIGDLCDPRQLDLVITIGPEANKYLAPAAEAKGCKVQSFDSPYTAGDYLKTIIKKGTLVLVKGSQNGVFAEETVKLILAKPADAKRLVRQTDDWMKLKQKAFKR